MNNVITEILNFKVAYLQGRDFYVKEVCYILKLIWDLIKGRFCWASFCYILKYAYLNSELLESYTVT